MAVAPSFLMAASLCIVVPYHWTNNSFFVCCRYEAIIRGWLQAKEILWLMVLDVVSSNVFLALFFSWSHDSLVFTRSDKSFLLYTSIMTTFIVQAFFFSTGMLTLSFFRSVTCSRSVFLYDYTDETEAPETSFWGSLWDTFLQSLFTKIFLFPTTYLLPYMISSGT